MLQIGSVLFDPAQGQEPPAPPYNPPAVRSTLLEALETAPETVIYTGTSASRVVRFACAESFGYCTAAQRDALVTLYLSRATFTVVTDLLGVRGVNVTLTGCRFDPGVPPVFTPLPIYDGDHWAYDLPVRVPYGI